MGSDSDWITMPYYDTTASSVNINPTWSTSTVLNDPLFGISIEDWYVLKVELDKLEISPKQLAVIIADKLKEK